jgi:hypothetical protein
MTTLTTVTIFDKGMRSPVEIAGTRIGHGSSRREDSAAWSDVSVWKLDGGGFLIHRTGWSLVYHRKDTGCMTRDGRQRGTLAGVDELPDDAVPCLVCNPEDPEHLPDGPDTIRYEYPRHTFDGCDTPEKAVEKLTVVRHRDKTMSVQFSQPVTDALEECAVNDPLFGKFLPGTAVRFGT